MDRYVLIGIGKNPDVSSRSLSSQYCPAVLCCRFEESESHLQRHTIKKRPVSVDSKLKIQTVVH